jgi:hypothetical protein
VSSAGRVLQTARREPILKICDADCPITARSISGRIPASMDRVSPAGVARNPTLQLSKSPGGGSSGTIWPPNRRRPRWEGEASPPDVRGVAASTSVAVVRFLPFVIVATATTGAGRRAEPTVAALIIPMLVVRRGRPATPERRCWCVPISVLPRWPRVLAGIRPDLENGWWEVAQVVSRYDPDSSKQASQPHLHDRRRRRWCRATTRT